MKHKWLKKLLLKKEKTSVENDLEEAARIAKEKQRQQGLNVKEKQEFTSKFESLADASNKNRSSSLQKPK